MSVVTLLCVGAGGGLGAIARYALGCLPYHGDFPFITFGINVAGSFVIGLISAFVEDNPNASSNLIAFLKVGLCGGFTTFSTFSLEVEGLLDSGKYLMGGAYAMASLLFCVIGVAAGRALVRYIR